MLDRLVRNTAVTGIAFVAVSLINLLLIPILVHVYGLTRFGLLVLARVLLPTGFLAVLDFGFPELTTEAVARARVNRAWAQAGTRVGRMLGVALVVGLVVAAGLWALRDVLGRHVFQIDPADRDGFGWLIAATAAAVVVYFPGQVFEGVLKGFERYGTLRSLDIASNLAYAVAAAWLAWSGQPFEYVGFAFLAANTVRYLVVAPIAVGLFRAAGTGLRWRSEPGRELFGRAWVMFQSKALGAIQGQSLPLVIGALVSPAGVAVYDVLMRLPRFLKVVFATLSGPVLPVSARLEEASNRAGAQRLIGSGLTLLPVVTLPIFAGGALFAEDILRVWMGPAFAPLWGWLSALFLASLLTTIVGFGQMALLVRPGALRALNLVLLGQLLVTFLLGIDLVGRFAERAFILSQVVAVTVTFPLQLSVIVRAQQLALTSVARAYARILLAGMPVAGLALYVSRVHVAVGGVVPLLAALSIFATLYWLLLYMFTLTPWERAIVRRVIASSLTFPTPRPAGQS